MLLSCPKHKIMPHKARQSINETLAPEADRWLGDEISLRDPAVRAVVGVS